MHPLFISEMADQRRQVLTAAADRHRLFRRSRRSAAEVAAVPVSGSLAHVVELTDRLSAPLDEASPAASSPLGVRVA